MHSFRKKSGSLEIIAGQKLHRLNDLRNYGINKTNKYVIESNTT